MRALGFFICLLLFDICQGQEIKYVTPEYHSRISAALQRLAAGAYRPEKSPGSKSLLTKSFVTRKDGKLNVELINRSGQGDMREVAEAVGLEVGGVWHNRADCYVVMDDILDLAARIPEGFFLKAVYAEPVNDEGPGLQNSQSYINAGKDGSGIKIAILDTGFDDLQMAINAGAAPANAIQIDITGNGIDGNTKHGTGCLEVAFDNAPGATYHLINISSSSNATQFGIGIDSAIARGVDILSISLGPHNTGWDDNTGAQNEAVITAVNAGILVFVSAGNEARKHWQGPFQDTDEDTFHEWDIPGTDESNICYPDSGQKFRAWLQWDSPESVDHYDLFLIDGPNAVFLDISAETSEFEYVEWTNNIQDNYPVILNVKAKTANPPPFELFSDPSSLQYQVVESSIECPGNVTFSNCISVGAVQINGYNDPPGSTPIRSSSSNGPTNNGVLAPDFCAPNQMTTVTNSTFTGTSCATPNAAGAAAALWSAHPNYSASGIRQLLLRKAALYKDWGDTGDDNVYGRGGLLLKDYTPSTNYVYKFSGNNSGTNTLPYSSIQQADQYGPTGSDAFFLGHTHQQPPAGTIIDKPMIYRSVVQNSAIE